MDLWKIKLGVIMLAMQGAACGSTKTLKISYPSTWGKLIPSLQNSVFADSILGNIYEPLIEIDPGGQARPLAAKSWAVSGDLKTFTIKVDTSKRFSNGQSLSAADFKKSWEHGYKLIPASGNHSLADVLENLLGAEEFEATGHFKGIETPDSETLILKFKTPFRIALDHLSGARYAAFLIDERNRYLGTGRYALRDGFTESHAHLEANPFHQDAPPFKKVEIKALAAGNDVIRSVSEGAFDIATFVGNRELVAIQKSSNLEAYGGLSAGHLILAINGLEGRPLSKKEHRQALQYMVHEALKAYRANHSEESPDLAVDAQVYMELQSGRIPDSEVEEILASGEKHVHGLIAVSKRRPLKLVYGGELEGERKFIVEALSARGLRLDLVKTEWAERSQILYKTSETDIAFAGQSVFNGDPDGLYHSQGHHGAILFPMTKRKAVADLLESGRALTKFEDVHGHYQKVSRAVLDEVPFVHIGFSHLPVIYRSDRIRLLSHKVQSRVREYYHLLAPKV